MAYVQSAKDTGFGVASPTLAYGSNNTAGNLLIAVAASSAAVSSITDSAGNTWTKVTQKEIGSISNEISLWYAKNCAGGANTVTFNFGASVNSAFAVAEYSLMNTSSPLDVFAAAKSDLSPSADLNSGATGNTAQPNELVVFAGASAELGATSFTAGTNFTEREDTASANFSIELSDRTVSAVAGYTGTATASASVAWGAIVATFKALGGARSVAVVVS